MGRRSLVVWFLMLVLASVNGAIREALLIPMMGDVAGRAVSTLTLSGLVLLLTYLTIRWVHPRSRRETWIIGIVWVTWTLAFVPRRALSLRQSVESAARRLQRVPRPDLDPRAHHDRPRTVRVRAYSRPNAAASMRL